MYCLDGTKCIHDCKGDSRICEKAGTVPIRFNYLLKELELRFPNISKISAEPPENLYLREIDLLLFEVRKLKDMLNAKH